MRPHAPRGAFEKASRRLLPFVFLLFVIAYLDRANLAFAKLTMTAELGFSEAVFGLGAGLFFLGYCLFEIPGAILVEKWSARRWMARILLSWGLCTILSGFVRTANEFYLLRFLLGVSEASFFPGMIIYLSHWFPSGVRARATSAFLLAIPVALVAGAPISGALLEISWLGLSGWRWVFILEGLPAIVLGIVTIFYLTDHPREANWLSEAEKRNIEDLLASERRAAGPRTRFWEGLRQPNVMLLSAALFFANFANAAYTLWLPTLVQGASGLGPGLSAALSAVPFSAGLIAIPLAGWSSDRSRERRKHAALPMLFAGLLFAPVAIPQQPLGMLLFWLFLTSAAKYFWPPSFWVLPTLGSAETSRAAAIGVINSLGNLGSFFGPYVVGKVLTAGYGFGAVVLLVTACLVLGSLLVLRVRVPHAPGR